MKIQKHKVTRTNKLKKEFPKTLKKKDKSPGYNQNKRSRKKISNVNTSIKARLSRKKKRLQYGGVDIKLLTNSDEIKNNNSLVSATKDDLSLESYPRTGDDMINIIKIKPVEEIKKSLEDYKRLKFKLVISDKIINPDDILIFLENPKSNELLRSIKDEENSERQKELLTQFFSKVSEVRKLGEEDKAEKAVETAAEEAAEKKRREEEAKAAKAKEEATKETARAKEAGNSADKKENEKSTSKNGERVPVAEKETSSETKKTQENKSPEALEMVITEPTKDEKEFPLNGNIVIEFNESILINKGEISIDEKTLDVTNPEQVEHKLPQKVIIKPQSSWSENKEITMEIPERTFKSLDGRRFNTLQKIEFKTRDPLISLTPKIIDFPIDGITSKETVTVKGTAEAGSLISVFIDGKKKEEQETKTDEDGKWLIDLTPTEETQEIQFQAKTGNLSDSKKTGFRSLRKIPNCGKSSDTNSLTCVDKTTIEDLTYNDDGITPYTWGDVCEDQWLDSALFSLFGSQEIGKDMLDILKLMRINELDQKKGHLGLYIRNYLRGLEQPSHQCKQNYKIEIVKTIKQIDSSFEKISVTSGNMSVIFRVFGRYIPNNTKYYGKSYLKKYQPKDSKKIKGAVEYLIETQKTPEIFFVDLKDDILKDDLTNISDLNSIGGYKLVSFCKKKMDNNIIATINSGDKWYEYHNKESNDKWLRRKKKNESVSKLGIGPRKLNIGLGGTNTTFMEIAGGGEAEAAAEREITGAPVLEGSLPSSLDEKIEMLDQQNIHIQEKSNQFFNEPILKDDQHLILVFKKDHSRIASLNASTSEVVEDSNTSFKLKTTPEDIEIPSTSKNTSKRYIDFSRWGPNIKTYEEWKEWQSSTPKEQDEEKTFTFQGRKIIFSKKAGEDLIVKKENDNKKVENLNHHLILKINEQNFYWDSTKKDLEGLKEITSSPQLIFFIGQGYLLYELTSVVKNEKDVYVIDSHHQNELFKKRKRVKFGENVAENEFPEADGVRRKYLEFKKKGKTKAVTKTLEQTFFDYSVIFTKNPDGTVIVRKKDGNIVKDISHYNIWIATLGTAALRYYWIGKNKEDFYDSLKEDIMGVYDEDKSRFNFEDKSFCFMVLKEIKSGKTDLYYMSDYSCMRAITKDEVPKKEFIDYYNKQKPKRVMFSPGTKES